jgi:hypothetical protein
MSRFAAAVVICTTVLIPSLADESKWQPPPVPDGWKRVGGKDGTYQFAYPPGTKRTGTRERTFSAGGLRGRWQINYCLLKDDTLMEVQMAVLSGARLRGMTYGDLINTTLDAEREDGFQVSEPKEVTAGELKGKEYRLTKDKVVRRTVFFAAKPRIYVLNVGAEDSAKLDGETATTFLNSLVLVPAEVVKARAKEKAAKDEQAGQENLEKYGVKWTNSLKDMNPPDAPALGVIRGKEFKPDSVTIQPGNWLVFRQGEKGAFADVEVKIWLLPKAGESIENKTYEIGPAGAKAGSTPHVQVSTMPANRRVPQTESFLNRYAMKLTLGAKEADGSIPGTIYLCTPDSGKSFLAGKFTATAK